MLLFFEIELLEIRVFKTMATLEKSLTLPKQYDFSTSNLSPAEPSPFPGRRHRAGHMEHIEMFHCCEVFCGCAAISRAMEEKGYRSFRFDVRRNTEDNIHTKQGVLKVAHAMVKTYAVNGLAVFEPTCGSWIFISLGVTLRQIESSMN